MGNRCGCFGEDDAIYEGDDELEDDAYEYYSNYDHEADEASRQTGENVDLNAIVNELATNVNTINSPRPRTNSEGAVLTTDAQKRKTDKRRRNTVNMYNEMIDKSPKGKKRVTVQEKHKESKKEGKKKIKSNTKKQQEQQQQPTRENEDAGDGGDEVEVAGESKKENAVSESKDRKKKKERRRSNSGGISKNTKKKGTKPIDKQNIVEKMLSLQLGKLKERMKKKKNNSDDQTPDTFNV